MNPLLRADPALELALISCTRRWLWLAHGEGAARSLEATEACVGTACAAGCRDATQLDLAVAAWLVPVVARAHVAQVK